jgi:hypothetical protein
MSERIFEPEKGGESYRFRIIHSEGLLETEMKIKNKELLKTVHELR